MFIKIFNTRLHLIFSVPNITPKNLIVSIVKYKNIRLID